MSEPLQEEREEPWPVAPAPQPGLSPGHYAILFGLLLATGAIAACAIFLEPDPRGYGTHEQLGFQPCGMLQATAVPCPACGITTAVTLAARGRIWESAVTQPMGPLLVLSVPMLALAALLSHLRGKDVYLHYRRRKWPWWRIGLSLGLAAWAYRVWA